MWVDVFQGCIPILLGGQAKGRVLVVEDETFFVDVFRLCRKGEAEGLVLVL